MLSYLLNLFEIWQRIHFWPIFIIWTAENFYHQCELLDVCVPLQFSRFDYIFFSFFYRILSKIETKTKFPFIFCITLNSGIRLNISAKTHPIAHISTAGPYFDEPYKSSGALYHLLATYFISSIFIILDTKKTMLFFHSNCEIISIILYKILGVNMICPHFEYKFGLVQSQLFLAHRFRQSVNSPVLCPVKTRHVCIRIQNDIFQSINRYQSLDKNKSILLTLCMIPILCI